MVDSEIKSEGSRHVERGVRAILGRKIGWVLALRTLLETSLMKLAQRRRARNEGAMPASSALRASHVHRLGRHAAVVIELFGAVDHGASPRRPVGLCRGRRVSAHRREGVSPGKGLGHDSSVISGIDQVEDEIRFLRREEEGQFDRIALELKDPTHESESVDECDHVLGPL